MKNKKHCCRIGDHLAHYWRGNRVWLQVDPTVDGRWVKPTYWCSGKVIVEGGHCVHHQ